ncbi:MAG: hypothetical protein KJZ73_16660 [Pseudorhodoplanes sp.]|mgnify:CR=1 FL=1|nr:hypothetical protein [Pseudorhodoplanes sp.]MCL4712874.1 hypothetical protein [Pseudorhodoplanes sp.]MCQ3944045.1 hypothetical protein [Alphaproteobacteria bacterium]GIK79237.1 MAG: hypothetical protein BroJett024_03420 [Alphaproteobacteria bacterium]
MKGPAASALVASALVAAFTLSLAVAPPARAASADEMRTSEFSAARVKDTRKKTTAHRKPRRERAWHPASRFPPGDPSYGIEELERRRARGECLIDLGYGRFESCHVGGAM